ncbi:hypothetical protein FC83_GL000274 [Agrilactobacillus composti DSM 18527 = JCM 14202]|uniref:Surface layer protein A domain-containing protein n=1 Tax=Agrilactobacillus composti DSM 18527 = JCM 14202 TaxID=1423734 RepID=X0PUA0_9LACO|nr:hypothetical protein [Agrilactobacillus composti]KRM32709.1 hypothetical protein FC83_GL000274 [Agrilactobacillus composti DSM 18527 = JCM 14202]GAF41657.1 hypothetical protein JCM14202_3612 [Agrilactobacillus composti DSM 18527 = JCM 14202]
MVRNVNLKRLIYSLLGLCAVLLLTLTAPQTSHADDQRPTFSFKPINTYNDYDAMATVDGTWGANVFEGNDSQKVFKWILPQGSQWQVYGYTKRSDGYYFYAGHDLWIQGTQVKVPVNDANDAFLDYVIKYPDKDTSSTDEQAISRLAMADLPHLLTAYHESSNSGYWGEDYYHIYEGTPDIGPNGTGLYWRAIDLGYVVYPDGTVLPASTNRI